LGFIHNWLKACNSLFMIKMHLNPSCLSIKVSLSKKFITRIRVWRYQSGNQNPYIEEEQTTQWPKEKGQKDKQQSTKHTYKTKDQVTRTPLKTGGELRCSGRVSSSCSTSGYESYYKRLV
jgi:hypothetical protein